MFTLSMVEYFKIILIKRLFVNFSKVSIDGTIQEVIKSLFDMDLEINGDWGYSKKLATIIQDNKSMPIAQQEQMVVSMRSYIEMNITKDKEDRYAGINVKEINREEIVEENIIYHKIRYEITAILESKYKKLMKEYKNGYETEEFDMTKHFKERKKETLIRIEDYWFILQS